VDAARPLFAVHVGDAVYSETNDDGVMRRKWAAYRAALATIRVPVVQTLGNHDGFDAPTLALWKELWGETRFHLDRGPARLVALDGESVPAQVDDDQLRWLEGLLETAGSRRVFIFVHRPLFPVVGHIEDSLSEHPEARDRLHALLAGFRDRVGGVFHGHEHVFCHQDIDGVDYWHAAGSGSNLYASPQLGGFYHFLLVHVDAEGVRVEPRRVGAPGSRTTRAPRAPVAGGLLEAWSSPFTWLTWDYSTDLRPAPGGGMEFAFDPSRNPAPWLHARPGACVDLRDARTVALELEVPDAAGDRLTVTPSIEFGSEVSEEGSPIALAAGRNRVVLDVSRLKADRLAAVHGLSWTVAAPGGAPVWLRLVSVATARGTLEDWASGLLWYAWNDEVKAGAADGGGLRLSMHFATCRQPHLFTEPEPALDLSGIAALEVAIEVSEDAGDRLSVSLALERDRRCRSMSRPLRPGVNAVVVGLDEAWVPARTRQAVRRLEWSFTSADPGWSGNVIVRQLRTVRG
jgi:hypothetical protein